MPTFGIVTIPTDTTIQPAEFAKWVEGNGFDSLWFGEHTHIPVSRKSPFPNAPDLPEYYKRFWDPYIGLTAAACATTKIKVGTSISLIPEHNPITLAKMCACIDRVSNGRFILGIGGGWNEEELLNHGVALKDRWKVTRERVLAMREIWNNDEAEFHGEFVNFDKIWQWPKPLRKGSVPVLMGASSKWSPARIAEYCDGWLAPDTGDDLSLVMQAVKDEVKKVGRDFNAMDLSVITEYEKHGDAETERRFKSFIQAGFKRLCFLVNPQKPDDQYKVLESAKKLAKKFQ